MCRSFSETPSSVFLFFGRTASLVFLPCTVRFYLSQFCRLCEQSIELYAVKRTRRLILWFLGQKEKKEEKGRRGRRGRRKKNPTQPNPLREGTPRAAPTTRMMDLRIDMQRASIAQIGNLGLLLLWHILHLFVSIWYFLLGLAYVIQSYLISGGVLKSYKALNLGKLRYLAIVIESEEAYQTSKVIELLQWLEAIGVKRVCLYDTEGVLKKSKEAILNKLKNAREFKAYEDLVDQNHMALEFSSFSDGKEAVTKAANLLFVKYLKLAKSVGDHEEKIFTEPNMDEALKAISCRGPDPDLLLVYGPARCHLGFPAWRIRYTEIVHMGQLKSMRYGSLIKAIYGFTTVRQNYGK